MPPARGLSRCRYGYCWAAWPAAVKRVPSTKLVIATGIGGIAPIGKTQAEELLLHLKLPPFRAGPGDQPVRVERVVGAAVVGGVHGEADFGGALGDATPVLAHLIGRDAIFGGDMRQPVLATRRHVRIELERVEGHRRRDLAAQRVQRALQPG